MDDTVQERLPRPSGALKELEEDAAAPPFFFPVGFGGCLGGLCPSFLPVSAIAAAYFETFENKTAVISFRGDC